MRIQKNLAQIKIDESKCRFCRKCVGVCPNNIFSLGDKQIDIGNTDSCIGCLACMGSCPNGAITVKNRRIKKFFISRTCNNCCIMCFEDDRNVNKEYTTDELIKQFNKEICGDEDMIVLSGAEITTRKDLFLLLKHIRSKNQKARIFLPTNGRMFSYGSYVKKFMGANLGDIKITVSILGYNEQIHDKLTSVVGSFRQSVQGIKNLLSYKQNVNINVTILKQNYKGIPKICDYFLPMGVNSIQLALVEPNGKAKDDFKEFIPKMSDCMPPILSALAKGGGKVRVKNIPNCLLGDLYHLNYFSTQNHLKEMGGQCKLCYHKSECRGIWSAYIKIYGSNELKPILNKETDKQSKLIIKGKRTCFFSENFSDEFTDISFCQNLKESTLFTLYKIFKDYFNLDPALLYHHSTLYIDSKTIRKIYLFPSEKIIGISKKIRDSISNFKNKSNINEDYFLPFFFILCDIINYKYISKKFNWINNNYFLYAFSNLDIGLNKFYTNLLIKKSDSLNLSRKKVDDIINKLKEQSHKSNEKYNSFSNSLKGGLKSLFICLNDNEKLHQHTSLYFYFSGEKPTYTYNNSNPENNQHKNILLKKGDVFYV